MALKAHRAKFPQGRLIFPSKTNKPDEHLLRGVKRIAYGARLNCGNCVNKKGKSCKDHAVCKLWSLHKFRRTWATMHLRAGVSTYVLQRWIGHKDQKMLERYAEAAGVTSPETWATVNNTFAGLSL